MKKRSPLRFAIGVGLILLGLSWYIPAVAADTAGAILERRLRIMSRYN